MIDRAWILFFLDGLLDPLLIACAAVIGLVSTASHWAILGGAAAGAGFILVRTGAETPAAWIGACFAAMIWSVIGYRMKLLLRG